MSMPDLDDDAPAFRTRSTWPLLVFLGLLAAGAGYFAWRVATTPEPRRVLVAIDFDGHWFTGSRPAALLADELNEQLESLGFEPVRAGDPKVTEALETSETLRDAARKLKAAFVVTGSVKAEVIEHPVGGGYFEVRASGTVEVFHIDDETPVSTPVSAWAGARDRDCAIDALAQGTVALQATDAALPALLANPSLATLLAGDAKTIVELRPASKFVVARDRLLHQSEDAYRAYGERRLAAERGPVAVTYHGSTANEDALAGVGPRGVLVKTENARPFVAPRTLRLGLREDLETVEWRGPDGARSVLWSGYNVYSYPGVSRDGQVVVLIEDLFGWAKAVTRVGPDGRPKRLLLHDEHRYSSPQPSAAGTYVALYERTCRRCDDGLLVLDASGGVRLRVDREGGGFDGLAWLDDVRLAVLHTPSARPADDAGDDDEDADGAEDDDGGDAQPVAAPTHHFDAAGQTVWIVDVSVAPPTFTALRTGDADEHLGWMAADAAGKRLAFRARHPEGDGLAVLDIGSRVLTRHVIPGRTGGPHFSPAGAFLTFNYRPVGRGSDEEVAVMPTEGGPVKLLTDNDTRDRYPAFSHDGSRIYFESLGADPNHPKRGVALIASIPFAP